MEQRLQSAGRRGVPFTGFCTTSWKCGEALRAIAAVNFLSAEKNETEYLRVFRRIRRVVYSKVNATRGYISTPLLRKHVPGAVRPVNAREVIHSYVKPMPQLSWRFEDNFSTNKGFLSLARKNQVGCVLYHHYTEIGFDSSAVVDLGRRLGER